MIKSHDNNKKYLKNYKYSSIIMNKPWLKDY